MRDRGERGEGGGREARRVACGHAASRGGPDAAHARAVQQLTQGKVAPRPLGHDLSAMTRAKSPSRPDSPTSPHWR